MLCATHHSKRTDQTVKIQILSDLRLDRGGEIPARHLDADVIVLAGDVAPYDDGLAAELGRSWEGARHIVYVPGNVEFFGTEIDEARARLAGDCRETGIDFLDRAMVRIGGVPFIGATLWTDLKLAGPAARERTHALLAKHAEDFQGRIRHREKDFSPAESVRRHVADLAFIERELKQAERAGERAVVVTHHAPSALSVPPWRRGDAIGSLHASALDGLMERYAPRLWVHGSPYGPVDERLGATRLVANPSTVLVGTARAKERPPCIDLGLGESRALANARGDD